MASYDEDRLISEAKHQADHKVAVTSADHTAATIAHYTRLMAAAAKWGVANGSLQTLEALGVSVQPPNGYR
jgi:hypothetical protein